jgi:hypothetical protein
MLSPAEFCFFFPEDKYTNQRSKAENKFRIYFAKGGHGGKRKQ